MRRFAVLVLVLALTLVVAGGVTQLARAGASRPRATAARFILGANGVRRIRVGRSFGYLRARHLVGPLRPGCELGGPGTDFYAALRGRLGGTVEFDRHHRAVNVSVTHGAVTARGIGIGAPLSRVKQAYPGLRYRLDPTFGVYFVHTGAESRGFTIVVDGKSRRVTSLSAHYPPICE